jgi:diketogulonate reductase-like aldo/keto reductase
VEEIELGASGERISLIGLGTRHFRGDVATLRRAVALGVRFIDTAEVYGSEEFLGQALEGVRDRVLVGTKVAWDHLAPAEVRRAAEASLKKLRRDCIDLYQIHRPNGRVPLEDTLGAMEDLVDEGKVRLLGVCNFSRPQLERAVRALRRARIVSNQLPYNPYERVIEREDLPFCRSRGILLIAARPLGHWFDELVARDRRGVLDEVARRHGVTPAQVVLNWCIGGGGVVAIPKASSRDHVEEACGASGWRLCDAERAALEESIRAPRTRAELALRGWVSGVQRRMGLRPGAKDWWGPARTRRAGSR